MVLMSLQMDGLMFHCDTFLKKYFYQVLATFLPELLVLVEFLVH